MLRWYIDHLLDGGLKITEAIYQTATNHRARVTGDDYHPFLPSWLGGRGTEEVSAKSRIGSPGNMIAFRITKLLCVCVVVWVLVCAS